MATEALQILNLSPIPELSEMELSTVLEQLSSVSDPNGEVTDRNVEDIIRAAEELIDMSDSFKVDLSESQKLSRNDGSINIKPVEMYNEEKFDDKERKGIRPCDSESANDTLNISLSSEDISQKNSRSESLKSKKNETSPSQTELHSLVSPRSVANHIQSTLNSLRECSQKIKQSKISSVSSDEAFDICSSLEDEKSKLSSSNTEEPFSKDLKLLKKMPCEEYEKHAHDKEMTGIGNKKTGLKLIERNKGPSKPIKALSLDKSLKTLDCFERLYREKFVKDKNDIKNLKAHGKIYNNKQMSSVKTGKKIKSNKTEGSCKDLKSKNVKEVLQNSSQQPKARVSTVKDDAIDEDINIQDCLNLLQQESVDQNGGSNAISNYIDFTEKMLKQCTESISLLQGEVDDLKCQLKKNSLKEHPGNQVQCCSVRSLNRKEEINDIKYAREINASKGRTEELEAATCDRSGCGKSCAEMEVIEKLRAEVGNLKQCMITACKENNGISKLENQFSLLKVKYDEQIGKLEEENKKLKEILSEDMGAPLSRRSEKSETGVQTEKTGASRSDVIDEMIEPARKDLTRSVSLENCWTILRGPSSRSRSLETVDAATSPVRIPRELCSVSVQCRGESDPGEPTREGYFKELKELTKIENKENLMRGKAGSCGGSRSWNYSKQKKLSERENELMVTVRALHQEITAKDRDIKKMRNESELLRNQIKRLGGEVAKYKCEKKFCHVGTQTIGLVLKMREEYDPTMFQVSRELEEENDGLKGRVNELEKMINQLNDKRVNDLKILQKLHEEEIDKLASRLNTQTALTNHLHSLLSSR